MDPNAAPGHQPAQAPMQQNTAGPASGEPPKDMLDKLLLMIGKKTGRPEGQDRGLIEKVGDTIRKVVEKATGRKVPAKISN